MEHAVIPTTTITNKTRWLVAIGLSILFVVFAIIYIWVGYELSLFQSISFAAASTASLLFATALSMGSFSYFTSWPNMSYGFQKQIGIMAFWWSLFYSITLVVLYPELYWTGLSKHFFSADVLLGLCAMIIFTAMVLTSVSWIASRLSRPTIFFILGLGYVGYALLVIRAILLEFPLWLEWLDLLSGPPPGRLMLSIIAFLVLTLRLASAIDKHRKKYPTVK